MSVLTACVSALQSPALASLWVSTLMLPMGKRVSGGEGLCQGRQPIGGNKHQKHLSLAVADTVLFLPTTQRVRTRFSSLV